MLTSLPYRFYSAAAVSARLYLLLVLPILANSATARELTMLAPFPEHFVLTAEIASVFAAEVETESDGELTIRLYGPEVVPPFYQLEPVRAGIFDMLYAAPSYHSGDVPAAVAIGGIRAGPAARRSSGIWPAIDRIYAAHNLRLLSLPQLGSSSAQLVLTEPFDPVRLLQGLKIRSTLTYRHIVYQLGGTPVNMPSYDIFSSLDRGVIDGAAFGSVGIDHLQLHEVASHLVRPTFGVITSLILINEETWNNLSGTEQKLLLTVGERLEHRAIERFDQLIAQETRDMVAAGMSTAEIPERLATQLDAWFADGMWQYALRWGGESARALYELAAQSDMLEGSDLP